MKKKLGMFIAILLQMSMLSSCGIIRASQSTTQTMPLSEALREYQIWYAVNAEGEVNHESEVMFVMVIQNGIITDYTYERDSRETIGKFATMKSDLEVIDYLEREVPLYGAYEYELSMYADKNGKIVGEGIMVIIPEEPESESGYLLGEQTTMARIHDARYSGYVGVGRDERHFYITRINSSINFVLDGEQPTQELLKY